MQLDAAALALLYFEEMPGPALDAEHYFNERHRSFAHRLFGHKARRGSVAEESGGFSRGTGLDSHELRRRFHGHNQDRSHASHERFRQPQSSEKAVASVARFQGDRGRFQPEAMMHRRRQWL